MWDGLALSDQNPIVQTIGKGLPCGFLDSAGYTVALLIEPGARIRSSPTC
jgi:hypothetical protein